MAKLKKTTGPKKRSNLPKDFQRITNWEQLAIDSTDEEEKSRRQNAAIKAEKAAVKATVVWEKLTKTEADSNEEETTRQQSTERPKKYRKTPNYFGNPVMICDIEQKPEVITKSSSTEENWRKEELESRKPIRVPQLFMFKLDCLNVKNWKGSVTGLNQKERTLKQLINLTYEWHKH